MGIDAVWMTEDRREISSVGDPEMVLSRMVQRGDFASTACLRFLDPWGDAIFNQAQIPLLSQELEAAAATASSRSRAKGHLLAVAELVRGAEELHTYLWFVGD